MLDLRHEKTLKIEESTELKSGAAYLFTDAASGKKLVAKLIGEYEDNNDWRLLAEFKKMALLSAEAQIGTVYFLAKFQSGSDVKSCYVLDYINGETLDDFLEKSDSLSTQQAQDIIHQICLGMEKAHAFEIFHNDLHDRNVMIDIFGNIKIIDFLWYNSSAPIKDKHHLDLQGFKNLTQKISKKLTEAQLKRMHLIFQACMNAVSFRGLPQKLSKLAEVSEELSMLNPISMDLVGTFLQEVPEDYNLSEVWAFEWEEIPKSLVSEIPEEATPTPQTTAYEAPKPSGRISRPPLIDIRLLKIESAVKRKFESAFFEVEKLGIMEHQVSTKGSDVNSQWEPYLFRYTVSFTPKFLRWKTLLQDHMTLFNLSEKTMAEVIFTRKL